ncbi:Fe(3+) ABC transporter substrate-binding protein [Marinomonas algicola]|uniref:Fe(3+) ABC transporter substrate-binding protein n=1 Tax=Marinomonas algicola TaxID=2773454 RepID=UPI0017494268|nr:Fe(3+) ABC transporter substrate-binding protein [Marinomonas algicola]
MKKTACSISILAATSLMAPPLLASDEVNLYSARQESLILPLLENFTEDTGITVNLITGSDDQLLRRLQVEGDASPADLFITVDAGRLHRAKEAGVLQPVQSDVLNEKVPSNLKNSENYWYSLSQRSRVIFYAKDRVDPAELSRYEGLADPKWKGRLCIRSSGNIYNQSLVASMIEIDGEANTQEWINGLVKNFARPPVGGDTDQLKAVAAGECDIAVANTYYFGRLVNSKKAEDRAVAEKLGLFWPNQGSGDRGAHVNVSGIGVTASSENTENAVKLIEYLLSDKSQTWYAEVNNEYPVVKGNPYPSSLVKYGEFKSDQLNLTKLGENNRRAVEMMDIAGWK